MPKAKLLYPNSLNLGVVVNDKFVSSTIYHKGKAVSVDMDTALKLNEDPRFEVTGIPGAMKRDAAVAKETRPTGAKLMEAIRAAIADLDKTDDDNFDRHNKPALHVLRAALGFTVTAAERDAAEAGVGESDEDEDKKPAPKSAPRKKAPIEMPSNFVAAEDTSIRVGG